ncbi:polyprenyl diphosphate synthase [Chrysiogenes arsenatis]|uniref:polyprenyl diphosphate synthase n=1 Tax=Chrysiogenes arsenatis TaxID=309797 RepID=UPI00040D46A2|nr:polyprenyl diphosphate synthase [Chrysiogenes arsenatis]
MVIVLDDDFYFINHVQFLCRGKSIPCTPYSSPQELFHAARRPEFAKAKVLIINYAMSEMNGFKIFRQIEEYCPSSLVVYVLKSSQNSTPEISEVVVSERSVKVASKNHINSLMREIELLYQNEVPKLEASKPVLPRHIGIIMDGNGRWAQQKGVERTEGHRQGLEVAKTLIQHAARKGIRYLTLYAFSTENWQRDPKEVAFLNLALKQYLLSERTTMMENNIRFYPIGRIDDFNEDVQELLRVTIEATRGNTGMTLVLAVSYGGQTEIIDAMQLIGKKIQNNQLLPEEITHQTLLDHLYFPELKECDFVIRTSGECRLSNFLTYQSAYSELYFTPILWPDFTPQHFDEALDVYRSRERRFGRETAIRFG